MENRLGYFTLETPDIDKARAFFGALFGWDFSDDASRPTYAHVSGSREQSGPAFGIVKGERKDFSALYFRVSDIEASCARVEQLGGKAAVPSESDSGRHVVVEDDQGVTFSLWEPAPGYV